jgi:hypothetical protein
MTLRLTPDQAAYLKAATLPPNRPNKLRIAVQLLEGNKDAIAEALGFKYTQLNRYAQGDDLLLSTAFRIASQLGVSVCDLWPMAPKASRAGRKRKAVKASVRKGPRAEAA